MSESFRFVIADKLIECSGDFKTCSDGIKEYLRDYLLLPDSDPNRLPDLAVSITEEDIEKARRMLPVRPADYILSDIDFGISAIFDKLTLYLASEGILFVHGSAVAVDGEAFIFTAASGTGKSTHRALWQQLLGERVTVINDDKPFVKVCDDGCCVYGSPLSGKEHLHTNCSARLKAICILERGTENSIEKISFDEALPHYMPSIRFYKDPVIDMKVLDCIDKIGKTTEFYRLRCLPDIKAAEMAYLSLTNSRIVSE